jgi:hypothetical protein
MPLYAGKSCPGAKPTLALESYTKQVGAPILALAGIPKTTAVATADPPKSATENEVAVSPLPPAAPTSLIAPSKARAPVQ